MKKKFWKRARSSITGRFISLRDAIMDKIHSIIETVK